MYLTECVAWGPGSGCARVVFGLGMPNSALSDAHVSMLSSKSGALRSAQLPPKMLRSIPKHTGALAKTTQCAWTNDNLPEMLKCHEKSTHNKGKNELTTQNGTVQRWYGPPENELSSVVAIQCSSCYLMHGCKPKRKWMRQLRHRSSRPLAMRQIHRNWIRIFGQATSPQRTKGKVSLCFASDRSEQVESNRHVVINSSRHVAIEFFKKILEF